MRVYISADMEGATGVTNSDDVFSDRPGFERFRRLLTRDVNSVVEGAVDAGATEILINESHGPARNILIEELNSHAEMITGYYKPLGMMEGINESFDAAMFVAFHAMSGTDAAVMDHTIRGKEVLKLTINGKPVGEIALCSAVAGWFNVPVVLVTGDDKVAAEAKALLGDVETVIVKQALNRFVARCAPPEVTTKKIRHGAKTALSRIKDFKPYKLDTPVRFDVDFNSTAVASMAALLPEVTREGPRSISFRADNFIDAYKRFRATVILGTTAADSVYG
ncbi:MAG TPA: M55 family metallopeptidase [Candidatus Bathyarchaeia archaeon]|nr:M55 family metallopeptidase [Candidatus Bathyarchaeia archaeon]